MSDHVPGFVQMTAQFDQVGPAPHRFLDLFKILQPMKGYQWYGVDKYKFVRGI